MASCASVYTIPIGKSFVDVLAYRLLDEYGENPETLSRVLVLVPNRRSCQALRDAFLRYRPETLLLLPRIRPIGDVEEDELFFLAAEQGGALAEKIAGIAPAFAETRRLMLLARAIWELEENSIRPVSASQAFALAQELARFLDEMACEGLSIQGLAKLVPAEYAEHWQITLEFLSRLFSEWPAIVASERRSEPVERRNRMIAALAEYWQKIPPDHPIVAAGTTGSIPATAMLLGIISRLPQGKVILPGLDLTATNDVWAHVGPSHPQAGLKQLLERMGCERKEVRLYDSAEIPGVPDARLRLVHEALRPAGVTDLWRHFVMGDEEATENISYHSCRTVQEEAKVIALYLREALDTPGKTAALVTHDRTLAAQVAIQVARFGITLDDSAGQMLSVMPEAVFFRLLAKAVHAEFAPVSLLALLKHPFTACGMAPAACRDAARILEKLVLRGLRPLPGLQSIHERLAAIPEEVPDEVYTLLARLEEAIHPYRILACTQSEVSLTEILAVHIKACEAIATTDTLSGNERLWSSQPGQMLKGILEEALEATSAWQRIHPVTYPDLAYRILAPHRWWPSYGQHPRLHILSPVEARLQRYDRVILSGLNEGNWPPPPVASPWMSRPMREQFGLPSGERQTGQAAHDFMMLMGAPEVILTRAERVAGSPTVPARWLVRLTSLIARATEGSSSLSGASMWQSWALQLDKKLAYTPISPPAPSPPIPARPRTLPVTAIETLMRDPYAIYARYVLSLRALDPIDREPDVSMFGRLFHKALEDFIKRFPAQLPKDTEAELWRSGQIAFTEMLGLPMAQAYWMPRYTRICNWLAAQERLRRGTIGKLMAEKRIEWKWQAPAGAFTLTARVDRIEIKRDGSLCLVDYKTGAMPLGKEIEEGYASQLPLSAVVIEEGASDGTQVAALEYWKLGGVEAGSIHAVRNIRPLIESAKEGVTRLIAAFDDPLQSYHAVPVREKAPRYSDYAYLARMQEWAAD